MPVTRTLVNTGNPIITPDGELYASKPVTFQLVKADTQRPVSLFDAENGEYIVGDLITATTDGAGLFSQALWPNSRGGEATYYLVSMPESGMKPFLIYVTDAVGVLLLINAKAAVLPVPPAPTLDEFDALLASITAQVAQATEVATPSTDGLMSATDKTRMDTVWSERPSLLALLTDTALVRTSDGLAAAVAAAGSNKRTIRFTVDQTLSADLSVPANVELLPLNGAVINHGSYAFTYAGDTKRWPLAQVLSGTGAVLFTGAVKEIYPQWFGQTTDETGTSAPLQRSIISAFNSGVPLYATEGRYKITANLTLPEVTSGQRRVINASGPGTVFIGYKSLGVTKIFELGQTSQQATSDLYISDLAIAGSGDSATDVTQFVEYGIHGLHVNHSNFSRITVSHCSTAGIRIENGWSNNFDNVKVQYNQIGFMGRTAFNQNTFTHCKFWLNQLGLKLGAGQGNKIDNSLFEANAKTGAYLAAPYAATFDTCYFEGNAKISNAPGAVWPVGMTAGIAVGTPATTIKADIVIDSGSSLAAPGIPTSITEMAIFAPAQNITISGCSTAVYSSAVESFVYVIGVTGLHLTNNYNSTTSVPLVKTYQNGAYSKLANMTAQDNIGFSSNFAFDNATDGRRAYGVLPESITIKSAGMTNYAETLFARWNAYDTVVGTFTPRYIMDRYGRRSTVWALSYNNTAVTEIRGFVVDPETFPQNVGKTFVFMLDIKAENAGTSVNLYGRTIADAAFAVTTSWATYATFFTWPAVGGPFIVGGLSKVGNVGEVHIANPVLIEVGADYKDIVGRFGEVVTFYASAVPTTGVWYLTDRVVNYPPTVGQPKAWICTTAGGAVSTTRANATAYALGVCATWSSGTTAWEVTTAGTSAGTPPSIVGKVVGDTVTDGTVVWTMRSATTAAFTSEGNL